MLTYVILLRIKNPILTNHCKGIDTKSKYGARIKMESVKYAWIVKIGKTYDIDERIKTLAYDHNAKSCAILFTINTDCEKYIKDKYKNTDYKLELCIKPSKDNDLPYAPTKQLTEAYTVNHDFITDLMKSLQKKEYTLDIDPEFKECLDTNDSIEDYCVDLSRDGDLVLDNQDTNLTDEEKRYLKQTGGNEKNRVILNNLSGNEYANKYCKQ